MLALARRVCLTAFGLLAVAALGSCAGPGQYVWFERLPPDAAALRVDYLIGVGDLINIRVLGHDEMSVRQRLRDDGRLALLLIGEVEAKGKRPGALGAELEGRLKDYIVSPSVAVNIEESAPLTVVLLGEIAHPGAFPLEHDPRLSHALALGGGLTDFASRDSIFVVRGDPAPARIRFTYEAVRRNEGRAGEFQLRQGDIVEVE
jgi:polysaccharide export outer membrane protein